MKNKAKARQSAFRRVIDASCNNSVDQLVRHRLGLLERRPVTQIVHVAIAAVQIASAGDLQYSQTAFRLTLHGCVLSETLSGVVAG
ncbi:hypothetical protein [Roseibium album]|uniref:hypothetical protein n=1 Tax=Roseibium album TaxID=311410 RepID=UPI00249331C2|nr:hypothetical protein [Roseibium album]